MFNFHSADETGTKTFTCGNMFREWHLQATGKLVA